MCDPDKNTTVKVNFRPNEYYLINEYQSNIFVSFTTLGSAKSALSFTYVIYSIIKLLIVKQYRNFIGERMKLNLMKKDNRRDFLEVQKKKKTCCRTCLNLVRVDPENAKME